MATTYKVLGQSNPAITTLTTLYTCPVATNAIGSVLTVCNQGAATTFRIALRVAGAALDPKQYISYDVPIDANETKLNKLGIALSAGDIVSVYAGSANLSFNLCGCEIA